MNKRGPARNAKQKQKQMPLLPFFPDTGLTVPLEGGSWEWGSEELSHYATLAKQMEE